MLKTVTTAPDITSGAIRQFSRQSVLAPAAADDKDFHVGEFSRRGRICDLARSEPLYQFD
jgi:hypothetical protein